MLPTPTQTGGTCPSYNIGILVRYSDGKLRCNNCGYETAVEPQFVVDPQFCHLYVKQSPSTWQWLALLLVLGVLFLLVCGEEITVLLAHISQ